MTRQHERTERVEVVRAERIRKREYPCHLRNRVAAAREIANLVEGRVAQRGQSELRRDRFTLRASFSPRRTLERALDARVHDDDAQFARDEKMFDLECAAIEEDRAV